MRKLLAAILAVMMLLSMATVAVAEEKEPIVVTVFRGDPGDQPTEDNKIYKLIEEEFGITFVPTAADAVPAVLRAPYQMCG